MTDPIVTRKHRQLAYQALRNLEEAPVGSMAARWIETGSELSHTEWSRVALALARLEAQTAHRAWHEGREQGEGEAIGGLQHLECPYPPIDEVDDG